MNKTDKIPALVGPTFLWARERMISAEKKKKKKGEQNRKHVGQEWLVLKF